MENLNDLNFEELNEVIEGKIKEYQKFWTEEDKELINGAMKNIFDLPVEQTVHQAKKWALLTARASVVKIESEAERKEWFDNEISQLEAIMNFKK